MRFVLSPKSTGPDPPVPPDIPRIGATLVTNRGYSVGQKRRAPRISSAVANGALPLENLGFWAGFRRFTAPKRREPAQS
jgi:hypothetical protein